VQRLRRLLRDPAARREEGVLVAEGVRVVEAALGHGASVEAVYVAADGLGGPAVALVRAAREAGVDVQVLAPGVMARIADAVTPQPVLATVRVAGCELEDVAAEVGSRPGGGLLVVAVDVRDPGNLGSLLRSAEALGAAGVVVSEGCVDFCNPKVVRASAGSLFSLPVSRGGPAPAVVASLRTRGFRVVASLARGGRDPALVDWSGAVALLVGNEAAGLPGDLAEAADEAVTVPLAGRAESLNVAVAGALCCYEAARRRAGTLQ
jgi:TrmH family RNA methyltransferase